METKFSSNSSSSSIEQTFAAKSFQKDKGKFQQSSQQKPYALALDNSQKKNIQCNYCHKFGHMKVECQKHLAPQSKQSGSQATINNVEHFEQTKSTFYVFWQLRALDRLTIKGGYYDNR